MTPSGLTLRMRLLQSVMYTLPSGPTAPFSWRVQLGGGCRAAISGKSRQFRCRRRYEITPAGDTLRIRLLPESAISRLPAASLARPAGVRSRAEVACPPSPLKPNVPSPAAWLMMVPLGLTLQTRLVPVSATSRLPLPPSTATSEGPAVAVTKAVLIVPSALTLRIRLVTRVGDQQITASIHRNTRGDIQVVRKAQVPPSPLKPDVPLPAAGVPIIPAGVLLRIR